MVSENKQNRRYKQINFIGLQNNRHPSQHTVGNVHKDSGNYQQRPLLESIAEPLSHVLGLPPRLQNVRLSYNQLYLLIVHFTNISQYKYCRCVTHVANPTQLMRAKMSETVRYNRDSRACNKHKYHCEFLTQQMLLHTLLKKWIMNDCHKIGVL